MASSSGKRGAAVERNERNIIVSVVKCCVEEETQKFLKIPINKATERAAKYCNVSTGTIKRIRRELKECPEGAVLPTPGTTLKRPECRNAFMDEFDLRVIREVIEGFYLRQRTVPTCSRLLPVLKDRINFKWSDTTLRRILKEMGFVWKKCGSRKKILIEKESIVSARCEYLQKIRQFRDDGKPIFYLDETWVDRTVMIRKCWSNKKLSEEANNGNDSGKVHILHIGGSSGFLDGCELVYTTSNRQDYLTWETFKTWICDNVIPSLVKPSVIIAHNICYRENATAKPPTKLSSKKEIVCYLRSHGIPCDEVMRKFTLLSLADKTMEKKNAMDPFESLLAAHGHTVVWLPRNMCDLNAIELAWRQIGDYIQSKNLPMEDAPSLETLEKLVFDGIKCVSNDDWEAYCRYVSDFEDSYWKKDASLENILEEIICNLGEIEDSSDQDSSGENSDSSDLDTSTDDGDAENIKPLPEIVEYKLQQPTVLEKIELTQSILDKSKTAKGPAGAPANTATNRYPGSGRPLEKRLHQEVTENEHDDDRMFMLSLTGKMKHLSPADNMKFRLEVQQLLLNKLCPDVTDNAPSSSSSFTSVLIKEEIQEEPLTDENLASISELKPPPVKIKKEVVDENSSTDMDFN